MKLRANIPNAITCLNLVCGLIALVLAFKGMLEWAMYLMISAAVFDFLDGLAARALGAYSELGKQLDSLADLVSFGVLPAIMLYKQMSLSHYGESLLCYVPLLIAVFSALRLAKFNIDPRQSSSFLGLPTPACALLCAALCSVISHHGGSAVAIWAAGDVFIPVLSCALCALLVCEVPMFSLKFHKDDPAALRIKRLAFAVVVAASIVLCLLCSWSWSTALLLSLACYILKNIIYAIARI